MAFYSKMDIIRAQKGIAVVLAKTGKELRSATPLVGRGKMQVVIKLFKPSILKKIDITSIFNKFMKNDLHIFLDGEVTMR